MDKKWNRKIWEKQGVRVPLFVADIKMVRKTKISFVQISEIKLPLRKDLCFVSRERIIVFNKRTTKSAR